MASAPMPTTNSTVVQSITCADRALRASTVIAARSRPRGAIAVALVAGAVVMPSSVRRRR